MRFIIFLIRNVYVGIFPLFDIIPGNDYTRFRSLNVTPNARPRGTEYFNYVVTVIIMYHVLVGTEFQNNHDNHECDCEASSKICPAGFYNVYTAQLLPLITNETLINYVN